MALFEYAYMPVDEAEQYAVSSFTAFFSGKPDVAWNPRPQQPGFEPGFPLRQAIAHCRNSTASRQHWLPDTQKRPALILAGHVTSGTKS